MTDDFIKALRKYFTTTHFSDDHSNEAVLYAYDDSTLNRTFLTTSEDNKSISLLINNPNNLEIVHICIDGGIVEYGNERYQGDGLVHQRCDCMVFSDSSLKFIEFKMNMTSTLDKSVWRNCSDAMKAIRDFVSFFYMTFEHHGDSFSNYYSESAASAVVCIRQIPNMVQPRNTQRLTEKEKFTAATNLKVDFITQCEY